MPTLPSSPTSAQTALDLLPAHIAILDGTGRIVAVNAAWRRFAAEVGGGSDHLGADYLAVCDRADDPIAARVAEGLRALLAGESERFSVEYPCHGPTVRRWFRLHAARHEAEGEPALVLVHEPVTELVLAREALSLQATLLDEIDVAVILTDLELRVLAWNAGAERLYGFGREEMLGCWLPGTLISRPVEDRPPAPVDPELGVSEGEFILRRKDGTEFIGYVRLRELRDRDGAPAALLGVSFDVTERAAAEQALVQARNHLSAITDSMGEGLYTLDGDGRVTYVNRAAEDLLGWSAAELAGRQIHAVTHPAGNGSASGGEPAAARSIRERTVVRVDDDVFIRRDGTALPVSYTAAPFETDGGAVGCVVVFEDASARRAEAARMQHEIVKLSWLARLRDALAGDQFTLAAQPIVDLASGETVSHELLLRLAAPDGSTSEAGGPGVFLPVAEETGLISRIDHWVVQRAAEHAATGRVVNLNVSACSISDRGFVARVRDALAATGADPARLVFEITETALITDADAARAFVEGVHELGCRVALDDFGTGYGGFTYLKHLPIDYLKIDSEFVRDLQDSEASLNVLAAIVGLARGFNVATVAEGVEDAATLALLRQLGVHLAQGFYLGRPATGF